MIKVPVIALAAGGTGGHVFPAEALAHELQARGKNVLLITDQRAEHLTRNFPANAKIIIEASSPSRNPIKLITWFWRLWQARSITRRFLAAYDCSAMVGFGGYPSVPALLAAGSLGIPLILHEQNAVLGRANRLGATKAKWIASGFEQLQRLPPTARDRHVALGNPLRPQVLAIQDQPMPMNNGQLHLTVMGGSLGARILSEAVPAAIALLSTKIRDKLFVTAQITKDRMQMAKAMLDEANVRYELASFFDDAPQKIAASHLVIARAGASTVSELAAIGRPSILIPLAIAMDDHQSGNANVLKQVGAADIISEEALTPERLAGLLQARLSDMDDLQERARAAKTAAKSDAARKLADLVLDED